MAGTSFLARNHVTIVRHAGETRDKEARNSREKDKKSKQIWRRAAFFVLGYFSPVLNEIRYIRDCIYWHDLSEFLIFKKNCFRSSMLKLQSWGDWERKDSQNGYKNREPTYYHKLSFHHKLSQTLQTFTNFTQHLVKGHWSPSCLIHRQLHQRGHRESHGRRKFLLAAMVEQ